MLIPFGAIAHRWIRRLCLAVLICSALAFVAAPSLSATPTRSMSANTGFLTDPFLQNPTETSVRVVWFTEFAGVQHRLAYGENLNRQAVATTTQLSRSREDANSHLEGSENFQTPTRRDIWRHEAEVTGLTPGRRVPYRVTSVREDGQGIDSDTFTLAPLPQPGQPLQILLTSDHQLKPMTAANLQKVVETVGRVDAVFLAGDLVNIPDRASEWFDDNRGGAFFPCLQGRAGYEVKANGTTARYTGGQLIQNAPLFTAIGNHEVMGRFSTEMPLGAQFNDTIPRHVADTFYAQNTKAYNPIGDPTIQQAWIQAKSFNTDTYREIFSLPKNQDGDESYYAVSFGDIRLVVLYVTNMWRKPNLKPSGTGRYYEDRDHLDHPQQWGYGQHIFHPINRGSRQYRWLEKELESSEFQQAKYKIVMFHHPPHSLGDNIVPPFTDPVQTIARDENDKIQQVRYDYPKDADYIIRDVVPLLEQHDVQLVFYGHSHLWNRFTSSGGMHFLETSNVGNTYGANWQQSSRKVPQDSDNYVAQGDPNGLDPVVPTIAPLTDKNGTPLPYLASNEITAFSIFNTGTGTVTSYRFDTRQPDSPAVAFDRFELTPAPGSNHRAIALIVTCLAVIVGVVAIAWQVSDKF
jgi:hypothetical protein